MNIHIFEPQLIQRRGYNGFYRHFLTALVRECGARPVSDPRPLPRLQAPREHESCWTDWNGALVFFDMSDHVQMFDIEALKKCQVYFKANLHTALARRILIEAGVEEHFNKCAPFLFFSEGMSDFMRDAARRRFWRCDQPRYDLCFVMGVYENAVRDRKKSPFEFPDEPMTPASYHFWIRWHMMQSFQEAGISGYYRLTSRANTSLEDGIHVYGNMSRRAFSRCISHGRMTVVCTLPHALFPWKASESFVLGRPIIIEQKPLTETPAPFLPTEGEHYFELFPNAGAYHTETDLADPRSYRVLDRIPLERFKERADWMRKRLSDRKRLSEMGRACRAYADRAYNQANVAQYIQEEVLKRI